jgi:hypothetical protein
VIASAGKVIFCRLRNRPDADKFLFYQWDGSKMAVFRHAGIGMDGPDALFPGMMAAP